MYRCCRLLSERLVRTGIRRDLQTRLSAAISFDSFHPPSLPGVPQDKSSGLQRSPDVVCFHTHAVCFATLKVEFSLALLIRLPLVSFRHFPPHVIYRLQGSLQLRSFFVCHFAVNFPTCLHGHLSRSPTSQHYKHGILPARPTS